MKRPLILVLKIAIAASLIAYLIHNQDFHFGDLGALRERWPWFLLTQACFGLILTFASLRWRTLLATQGVTCRVPEAVRLVLIGHFFNQFMLGSTGGDVVKAYYIASGNPEKKAAAILTVFLDRAVGLTVLLLIAGTAAFLNIDMIHEAFVRDEFVLTSMVIFIWSLLAAAFIGGLLFYSEKVRSAGWIQRLVSKLPFQKLLGTLSHALYIYKFHPRHVLLTVVLSAGIHVTVTLLNVSLCLCLVPDIPSLRVFFLLIPMAQIIMSIPVTPGSWGVSEFGYKELLLSAGLPVGALVSLLQRFTWYVWGVVGCAAYLGYKRKFRKEERTEHPKDDLGEDPAEQPEASARSFG